MSWRTVFERRKGEKGVATVPREEVGGGGRGGETEKPAPKSSE